MKSLSVQLHASHVHFKMCSAPVSAPCLEVTSFTRTPVTSLTACDHTQCSSQRGCSQPRALYATRQMFPRRHVSNNVAPMKHLSGEVNQPVPAAPLLRSPRPSWAVDFLLRRLLRRSLPCWMLSLVSRAKRAVQPLRRSPQLPEGIVRAELCLATHSVEGKARLQDVVGGIRVCAAWTEQDMLARKQRLHDPCSTLFVRACIQ